MSMLSSGLVHVGISRNLQRAAVAAIPYVGPALVHGDAATQQLAGSPVAVATASPAGNPSLPAAAGTEATRTANALAAELERTRGELAATVARSEERLGRLHGENADAGGVQRLAPVPSIFENKTLWIAGAGLGLTVLMFVVMLSRRD